MGKKSYGWSGSISDFLVSEKSDWLSELAEHEASLLNMNPSSSQISAWKNCYQVLYQVFSKIKSEYTKDWSIVFEYQLPRERGRRPDVILLTPSSILVLEFKDHISAHQGYLDQVSAYARDLRNYHAASQKHHVDSILVLTKAQGLKEIKGNVSLTSPDFLGVTLQELTSRKSDTSIIDRFAWCDSDYSPLPSLVRAARDIFHNEPLPQIRRAQSAGIPETLDILVSIAKKVLSKDEKHLALVTGVPGAGKTLVGLQFVYENFFKDVGSKRTAILLSGNGPLVNVLQHSLKSSIFVRDVHGYLLQYGGESNKSPEERIWVYDEAQRAWDVNRVKEKRPDGNSEPEDFLLMGEKKSSAFMIGLIGQGQEIHLGEESGLIQWKEAIDSMSSEWTVHCPPHIANFFEGLNVHENKRLNLDTSLRSHLAGDIHLWINQVLSGNIDEAFSISRTVRSDGFDMYLSQSTKEIKDYLQKRYLGEQDKRYGLLASSKAKNLEKDGINNSWDSTRRVRHGPWYNDPPESKKSCCQLLEVVTEFGCQGLELDFPVVAWGDDLKWDNGKWKPKSQPRSRAKDPDQLRINSYRVLLSRGRDGFVVYVPKENNSTYDILKKTGLKVLNN